MSQRLAVLKLGGSVLQKLSDFPSVCSIIQQYLQHYDRLAVVVSALKGMTDQLIEQAHTLSAHPSHRELDMLVSIGERMAASLLCIALAEVEIAAHSYTGSQAGILTSSKHTQARILNVTPWRLLNSLEQERVVVVAGFQGMSAENKEITTLGRGGTDTSAVALAIALKAQRVVFFKDVGGLYDQDPRKCADASRLSFCDFATAHHMMQTSKFLLHPRAVALAERNALPLHIVGCQEPLATNTLISTHPNASDRVAFQEPVYESL